MNKIAMILGLVLTMLLAGCQQGGTGAPQATATPTPASAPEIDLATVVITLQRTECHGTCPVYRVAITGDGNVSYIGERFVAVEGEQKGQIDPEAVRALVEEAYRIDYFNLQDRYTADVTDLPTTITSFSVGDQSKTIMNYLNAPQELLDLEQQIYQVAGVAQWVEQDAPPQ